MYLTFGDYRNIDIFIVLRENPSYCFWLYATAYEYLDKDIKSVFKRMNTKNLKCNSCNKFCKWMLDETKEENKKYSKFSNEELLKFHANMHIH